jgi:hypothetical protein
MDTTVYMQSQQVNYVLQQTPYVVDLTAAALMHLDTAKENIAINIQWSDGEITTHTGVNGFIHIYREYYTELSDTVYITNADTTIYSKWLWARLQNHPLNLANLFQCAKVDGFPPEPALARISNLPDTFNLFFQVKQVVDPIHQGQYIRTDSQTFLSFTSGAWYKTVRYTLATQVIDSIDNFRMLRDEYTGELVSQELLDQMCQQQDSAFALLKLSYGIKLIPPIRTEYVDDPLTNARYLAAQARGFDQAMITYYDNNLGTPGIYGVIPTDIYTIIVNGSSTVRISKSLSAFRYDALEQTKRAEQIGQLINADDVNDGGSGPYIYEYPNGENTDFAKVAAYTIYISNPATPLYIIPR